MKLSEASIGQKVKILSVGGVDVVRKHLGSLGFIPGIRLDVKQITNGNMIVGIYESRIAIDRQVADGIEIECV